ncbi:acyl-CoA N-acyltransferase [Xylariomycetidae sp. FL0641]|nr:acyl-CoA N-acyltransferase [Xylariomycetidae sp. FL0641]
MAADSNPLIAPELAVHPPPPPQARAPLETARLVLRGYEARDLEALHEMRLQPEVMKYTHVGRADANQDETWNFLASNLAPHDVTCWTFVMVLRHDLAGFRAGQVVGYGGVHRRCSPWYGWPELGYCIRTEFWGRGLATEFLGALTASWFALPREEEVIEVDPKSVEWLEAEGKVQQQDGLLQVPELVTTMIEDSNKGSLRVCEKNGFRRFKIWMDVDDREGYNNREILLHGFGLSKPSS